MARPSLAFHQHVLEMADKSSLTAVTRPLGYRIRRLFRLISDIDAQTMCHAHRGFFDALAARDGARAAECGLRHVVANREATLALFQARGWGAETPPWVRHRRQLTPRLPAARSCLTGRWMNPRRRTMATWEGLER